MPKSSSLFRLAVGVCAVGLWGCGQEINTFEFLSIVPAQPRLGENVTVTFGLTDFRTEPLAGQNVTFKLDAERKNVKLSPLSGTSLKGTGTVSTTLVATNRVAAVKVIAAAGGREAFSPPISFSGAQSPSARQLTFQCGELAGASSGGIHAIGAYDQSRYLIAGVKVRCFAHVADRNGAGMPGAIVSFITEAGTLGPSSTSQTDVIGNAEILYKTSLPFPKEVDPGVFVWNPTIDETHTGEYLAPLWMEPYRWTVNPIATIDTGVPALNLNNLQEPRRFDPIRNRPDIVPAVQYQNNPRDNLVAMIAVTTGEEGFTDVNNNGIWDSDANSDGVADDPEPFDDLTEPFVDSNDNGTWDTDEKFIDTNGNGVWNGKDGKWNASTDIWRQERILWTGMPNDEDVTPSNRNLVPVVRGVQGAGGAPISIACNSSAYVDFILADPWWNSLAQNNEGDGCSAEAAESVSVGGGFHGVAFTYPAGKVIRLLLRDKLDRKPSPMTTPPQPGCFPPMGGVCTLGSDCDRFTVGVECKFTASPEEGHTVNILSLVSGGVFKNHSP